MKTGALYTKNQTMHYLQHLAACLIIHYYWLMKIGVYGLGRFGYFWSKVLAGRHTVLAYNRSQDKSAPEQVSRCSLEELLTCEAIFICVSISAFRNVLESLAPMIRPGTLIIDTCSVKTYPVALMNEILAPEVQFLATHPMFGPDSGKNGTAGLPLVFSSGRLDRETRNRWLSFFRGFNLDVIEMTPEEHDREAAFTQGITHFVGRVLDQLHLEKSRIGTVGYRSLLEIVEQTCNDPLQLFFDLQRYNPFTHDMRVQLKNSIEQTMDLLSQADSGE